MNLPVLIRLLQPRSIQPPLRRLVHFHCHGIQLLVRHYAWHHPELDAMLDVRDRGGAEDTFADNVEWSGFDIV